MEKKIIRYPKRVNPIVYRKALELFYKDNPNANTPEISELFEGGYIQRARDIINAENRYIREQEIKSLHQKIDYLEQQIDFLEKQLEYREQLLREISENKKGYISELEQRVRELEEERRKLTEKIFEKIDAERELKRKVIMLEKELERYKPKSVQETQPKPVIIQNNETQKKERPLKWTIIKWTIIAIASLIFPLMPILLMPYLYFKISAILYPQNKKQQKITRYFE